MASCKFGEFLTKLNIEVRAVSSLYPPAGGGEGDQWLIVSSAFPL